MEALRGSSLRLCLIVLLLLFFSGCATLIKNDGKQDVDVTTEDGERILVVVDENGKKRVVEVPSELSLKSENTHATFSNHPCFEPAFNKKPEKKFDYITLLDIPLGVIGFAVDAWTEQMWEYEEPVVLPAGIFNPGCDEANESLRAAYGYGQTPPRELPVKNFSLDAAPRTFTPEEYSELKRLSGLLITRYGGEADVTSSITDESGRKRVIANGSERHEGYEIAFHNPVRRDRLYYSFVPRFMQHRVTIADFRESIPTVNVEGKTTIPYVVTDFYTGQAVDPLDPNRYTIRLDAGGVDLIGGSSMSFDYDFGSRFLLNIGVSAGVTLAEYRHMDLKLGRDRVEEDRFQGLNAYHGAVNGYLVFPDAGNFFVEFGYLYMHYPELDLPKKVEFKNTMRYNETKQIFERERVFVDSVELDISTFSLSLGVLF